MSKWGPRTPIAAAAAICLAAAVVWAAVWSVPLPDRLRADDSTIVEWRDGRAAHVYLSADDRWRMPVELGEVDPKFRRALVATEDRRFWWHPGVDPLAVVRAAWSNATAGRVVSGASTLTMQLVRLLEPRPRTLQSKVIEAFRAVQLEMRMSKTEILEAYLTYAPYGRNIEGIKAASHLYFDKPPAQLTTDEIATLLAVPQAPTSRYPDPTHIEELRRARNRLAGQLADQGLVGDAEMSAEARRRRLARLRDRPVPQTLGGLPQAIPHAADWLRERHPDERRIRTTLDRVTQRTVEERFQARRAKLQSRDIHNGAGVVVEHETGAVRALVGNFEYYTSRHGAKIPGFAVDRSAGSLLKPFLYALAIDRGQAAPSHLVRDVPASYAAYRPSNFEGEYHGLVRLEEALAQSLNIPFIDLLREYGMHRFLGDLRRLGVEDFTRPTSEYGLSVVVGGLEMTPLEVASLYVSLAERGRTVDPRVTAERRPGGHGGRVFSDEVSWLTHRALRKRDRPDFPVHRRKSDTPDAVHWKTGTSARNRDAWSAGFASDYTAVVWLGNFDRTRSPALVGARAAGPLLFDVLEAVAEPDGSGGSAPPEGLTEVEVCAFSGHLPTDACPRTDTTRMPRRSVASKECPYHVEREVDTESGLAVTPGCRSQFETTPETFIELPAGTARWMESRRGDLPTPPRYHPDCEAARTATAPAVEWPPPRHELVLLPGVPRSRQQVPLEASGAGHGAELHWFVDGEFLGTNAADERMWWTPEPGRHEVVVMDEVGRSSARTLRVRAKMKAER